MCSGAHGVLFGVAFLIVNAMQAALYALGARAEHDLLDAVLRDRSRGLLGGSGLILVAGFVDGGREPVLWLAALAVGFFGAGAPRGRAACACSPRTSPNGTG